MKKLSFGVEKVILYLAAGFAAYNFGLAGGYIEGRWMSIGGLTAGLVVNISLAVASSRYGSLKGDKRTRQAQLAFMAMLVLSPVLVAPVVYYSLPDTFLGIWWLRAAWAVAWPMVADLAIVLAGAVSGKGLIALSNNNEGAQPQQDQAQLRVQDAQVAGNLRASNKKLRASKAQLQVQLPASKAQLRVSKEQLRMYLQANPGASDSEVARNFGVSRQAIASRRKQLTPQDLGFVKAGEG